MRTSALGRKVRPLDDHPSLYCSCGRRAAYCADTSREFFAICTTCSTFWPLEIGLRMQPMRVRTPTRWVAQTVDLSRLTKATRTTRELEGDPRA